MGKNRSLHIDGRGLWGRVVLHFGEKLGDACQRSSRGHLGLLAFRLKFL